MSWRYVVYSDYVVVYPEDEYYQHDLDVWDNGEEIMSKCKCIPNVKKEDGIWIIRHDAFDGRQALEEAEEILKI